MNKFLIIPKYEDINSYMSLKDKYNLGFEYNDFFNPTLLDNEVTLNERINFYLDKKIVGFNTLHGAFFDVTVHSYDQKIVKISEYRINQSLEIARKLKVNSVVFHTNINPCLKQEYYIKSFLDSNIAFYKKLCLANLDMTILIENMFDETPDILLKLMEEVNLPNFRVCLDCGHANLGTVKMEDWFNKLDKYIKHVHLNDNCNLSDDHLAIGSGNMDYTFIIKELKERDVSVLIEVGNIDDFMKSYEYLKSRGL